MLYAMHNCGRSVAEQTFGPGGHPSAEQCMPRSATIDDQTSMHQELIQHASSAMQMNTQALHLCSKSLPASNGPQVCRGVWQGRCSACRGQADAAQEVCSLGAIQGLLHSRREGSPLLSLPPGPALVLQCKSAITARAARRAACCCMRMIFGARATTVHVFLLLPSISLHTKLAVQITCLALGIMPETLVCMGKGSDLGVKLEQSYLHTRQLHTAPV